MARVGTIEMPDAATIAMTAMATKPNARHHRMTFARRWRATFQCTTTPAMTPATSAQTAKAAKSLIAWCLTTELSGRPRCRLPHAEPANNLLATRVRATIAHGPLQRIVRTYTPYAMCSISLEKWMDLRLHLYAESWNEEPGACEII